MDRNLLHELNRARAARRAAAVVTDTQTGEQRLVPERDASGDPLSDELQRRFRSGRSGLLEDGRTFLTVSVPPPRLVVIGAVHISQALVPLAAVAGLDVSIIDPRTAFSTPERFPGVELIADWPEEALREHPLDDYTALAALTHDPKIDDVPLAEALKAGCFYVGALGSRKTHAKRVERLGAMGLAPEQIARIHAPIGLDIGAQSPAEIAVAVLAQVIQTLRRGRTVAEPAEAKTAA
ncbi:predicted sulfurylase large subunit, molybdopterin cytosine dinucleotide biosynthesis [Faunimonas pinastri]|uniref:Predicted sulfurylase large subunit, molybdopterin cytosine dinucleotide biosynthesis n=1 Tax=Faunimonas pinastri TaxID=1855383 RepID=A0A1H9D2W2_9HYPH|nr:XdhC family protein [Faunimonas pinastri]SEQ07711.1 predicted sulfurylase large subunit, molybdopterin cytosine dinucleotide biosynthesis [Faunimonas pinastri]